jgi:imidazolonepropionase-like amidohydrolase
MRGVNALGRPVAILAGFFLIALFWAISFSITGKVQAAQAPGATVFEGARLITGNASAPIPDAAFVVENGKFTAVGRKGQVKIPAGAAHVDLAGKTVMPAIIDTHKHLADKRDVLIDQLQHLAYYGVGVAMSLGQDPGDLAFQVRAETIPNAARLRTAGRGITMPEPGRSEAPYWITSEAEGRKAVRELAEKKVDLVKIWVDDRDHKYKKLSPEMYSAVIDEAHKHNLRVIAHIYTLEDAKGVMRAGIDAFAHSVRDKDIDDEFVQMFKARPNVILDPNLPDHGVATDMSWLRDSVSDQEWKKIQEDNKDNPEQQKFWGIQARNLAKLNAAGVKIVLGTDGPITWRAHVQMADMVAAGMTPAQVIVASTRNGAALLHLTDVGTVAAGKSADFLILNANPLDDITNTRKINKVYLRGTEVDRSGLRTKWTGKGSM